MLNLKDPVAHDLAKRLAEVTGRSMTAAVIYALSEQLRREEGRHSTQPLAEELLEIGRRCAALPDLDKRTPDEILGYNEFGAW
ncbi:MAG TPA: type II toxin-antitoxin system VapB family antitoxin [Bryobacteraceae bacterium]|nr:type II toxin-antitoxin system VapB family antitoxin [Bryobacteraceae bacterium]